MAGLYFHIPFCKSKCGYCSFSSRPLIDDSELENYFSALEKELLKSAPYLLEMDIKTIYFGGGTPSLAGASKIARLIDITTSISGKNRRPLEITLEANPESFIINDPEKYLKRGVN